jgi:DNA polymerase type B, organellar and viral
MDIETITKNNKIIPYLINGYDGRHHLTSFNNNESELFREFIEKLISVVEKGSITYIYAHNLSTFDGVLILKHLFKHGEVKPLIHHGKIISIKFIFITEGIKSTLIFKD